MLTLRSPRRRLIVRDTPLFRALVPVTPLSHLLVTVRCRLRHALQLPRKLCTVLVLVPHTSRTSLPCPPVPLLTRVVQNARLRLAHDALMSSLLNVPFPARGLVLYSLPVLPTPALPKLLHYRLTVAPRVLQLRLTRVSAPVCLLRTVPTRVRRTSRLTRTVVSVCLPFRAVISLPHCDALPAILPLAPADASALSPDDPSTFVALLNRSRLPRSLVQALHTLRLLVCSRLNCLCRLPLLFAYCPLINAPPQPSHILPLTLRLNLPVLPAPLTVRPSSMAVPVPVTRVPTKVLVRSAKNCLVLVMLPTSIFKSLNALPPLPTNPLPLPKSPLSPLYRARNVPIRLTGPHVLLEIAPQNLPVPPAVLPRFLPTPPTRPAMSAIRFTSVLTVVSTYFTIGMDPTVVLSTWNVFVRFTAVIALIFLVVVPATRFVSPIFAVMAPSFPVVALVLAVMAPVVAVVARVARVVALVTLLFCFMVKRLPYYLSVPVSAIR